MDLHAAAALRVADGNGQRVGGVCLRRLGKAQQQFDHAPDLHLARATQTGDCLFHFARSILVNGESSLGGSGNGNSADLAKCERDPRVLDVYQPFHSHGVGLMLLNQVGERIANADGNRLGGFLTCPWQIALHSEPFASMTAKPVERRLGSTPIIFIGQFSAHRAPPRLGSRRRNSFHDVVRNVVI